MTGAEQEIALFPLSAVLLPGMPLPLRIFEQRYRDLLADVTSGPGPGSFGVVTLRSGPEAMIPGTGGAPAEVEDIGTIAEIIEVDTKDDGTSDVLSVGSRRFRVLELLPEPTAYLRARVEYLDEPDGDLPPGLEARARELIDAYDVLLFRLTGRATGDELPADANRLSYHLAARLPLPPADRQQLLGTETTRKRLGRILGLLRREIALLRHTRSIAVSPAVVRMPAGTN